RAVSATCGAAMRHGPHHAAQKSTSTGTLLSRKISSNSAVSTCTGSAMGGSAALHAPHRPASARCFAGIRFAFPQEPQLRSTGISIHFSVRKDAGEAPGDAQGAGYLLPKPTGPNLADWCSFHVPAKQLREVIVSGME